MPRVGLWNIKLEKTFNSHYAIGLSSSEGNVLTCERKIRLPFDQCRRISGRYHETMKAHIGSTMTKKDDKTHKVNSCVPSIAQGDLLFYHLKNQPLWEFLSTVYEAFMRTPKTSCGNHIPPLTIVLHPLNDAKSDLH